MLAEAVRILASTAWLGRSMSGGAGDERSEPVERAKLVPLAFAGVGAKVQIEAALTGHPGSWEAEAGPAPSVFDSSRLAAVLSSKLTANGPDQRWTLVDV